MHDLRQALSRLHESHNELVSHVNRISSYQAEEMQKKQIEALKEIIAHTHDKSTAYANLIIIAGYVGFFSLWQETKTYLPAKAMIWSALLIAISAATFVLFEVFKMVHGAIVFYKVKKDFTQVTDPQVIIENFQKNQDMVSGSAFYVWLFALIITLVTGLCGAGILVYHFIAKLLS